MDVWKAVRATSAVLAVILAAVAVSRGEYFWNAVTGLALIALFYPEVSRSGLRVRVGILAFTIFPSVFQMAAMFVRFTAEVSGVSVYEHVSAFAMTFQVFMSAFIIVATIRAEGKARLTRGWMAVLSMGSAVSMSAMFMFYEYVRLYFLGYPLTNDDMVNPGDDIMVNGMLMSFPMMAIVCGSVMAYTAYKILKLRPIEDITEAVP
jgi:apolipoprotein N-acyltransferase